MPATVGEILDLPSITVGPRTGGSGTLSEIVTVEAGEIQFLALTDTEVAFVDNPTDRADMPPAGLAMDQSFASFDVMSDGLTRIFVNEDLAGISDTTIDAIREVN